MFLHDQEPFIASSQACWMSLESSFQDLFSFSPQGTLCVAASLGPLYCTLEPRDQQLVSLQLSAPDFIGGMSCTTICSLQVSGSRSCVSPQWQRQNDWKGLRETSIAVLQSGFASLFPILPNVIQQNTKMKR